MEAYIWPLILLILLLVSRSINRIRQILLQNLPIITCGVFSALMVVLLPMGASSQVSDTVTSPDGLKRLSIEELLNIEVTSVSRSVEKLTEVASAIQVITREDIRRSAASTIPEALRLAPNLQVAQIDSRQWIISARGFNSTFSNKLLVMIDGRTVYSPLFAGVFWDAQSVLLEDVDRIEVISGPGASLWGANAVNGVINIITKHARDARGLYVSAGGGTFLQDVVEARYGGKLRPNLTYRIYGQHFDRKNTVLPTGEENTDDWRHTQGGFSMDWDPSEKNSLSFQGNFYLGKETDNPSPSSIDGQNILGSWTHRFNEKSNLILQAYFDRTWRVDVPGTIKDQLVTYDFDLQHNFPVGKNQELVWGLGYRFMNDNIQHTTDFVAILPENREMHLFSGFVQDEIRLIPNKLKATLGTKFLHNTFSGFEIQPSARLSFSPGKQHMIWAAVSRAVRTPSRIDVDYFLPAYSVPPTSPSVAGGPNFTSEKLVAYELGYRVQPVSGLSLSVALFRHQYDDLYSVEPLPGTMTYQIQNGVKGYSQGVEFSENYQVTYNWRLRAGYTYFHKKLKNKPGNLTDPISLNNLGTDAPNRFLIHSIWNLPFHLQWDMIARYTDALPATQFNRAVAPYFTFDTRLAWQFKKSLEISLNGNNLWKNRHVEVGNGFEIPRGVYGKISWRY